MSDQPGLLIDVARAAGGDAERLVAIELEDFFDQNDDEASIAPNLSHHPGPQAIYEALSQLRDHPDVSAVVVLVRLELDEYPAGEWPFGEAIQVVTSAPLADIDALTGRIGTDPAFEGPWLADVLNPPEAPDGQRVVTVWWD